MAAVVVQPLQYVDVDRNRFAAFPNPNRARSCSEHVIEYLKTANGAFRELQLFERIAKAASLMLKEMGDAMAVFFDEVASKLGIAWGMLTIPRLPEVTKKAWEAFTVTPAPGPISSASRGIFQKIHDIAEAIAAWGYGLSLLLGNTPLKNAADVPNFVADVTDLSMASEDYFLAQKHLEYINTNAQDNGALQKRFVDTMREAFLRIVKAVSSVVSGALGLLVLAFGGPVVPGAVLLAFGLTSTIASLSAHFFKEMASPYEKVEFFKPRTPAIEVAGMIAN